MSKAKRSAAVAPTSFDEATHTYRIDGVIVPSNTQALRCARLMKVSEFWTDEHRERGKAVHLACQHVEQGGLDWKTVDKRIAGCVEAYCSFRASHEIKVLQTETVLFDRIARYGTRLDLLAEVNGQTWLIERKAVTKTRAPERWWGYQLAGQAMALPQQFRSRLLRYSLQLGADGDYRLELHSGWKDFDRFSAAVTICHARQEEEGDHHGTD